MVFPIDWIKKADKDLHRVGESLVSISRRIHEYTHKLEIAVEGTFASEASDPRVRLLSEALQVSRKADLELGWINEKLIRITEDWKNQCSQLRVSSVEDDLLDSSSSITAVRINVEELTNSISSLQQERKELETLSKIARELNSTLEFNSVLQRVMDHVICFVNAERGFLMLVDPHPHTGEPGFTIGRDKFSRPIAESKFTTISQNTVKDVIRTCRPVLNNDAQTNASESMLAHNIRSIMCAPLIVRDRCIGAVYVDSQFTTTVFEPRHRNLLLAFCNQAAIAIENARLFADLDKMIKQVQEDKQYMANIFASIANGVVTTSSDGIITTFNAAAGVILALPPGQIIGQHYINAFRSLPQAGIVELLNKAHTQHENGTLVNESIECTIPGRTGIISLNCYVNSLRDTQNTHIGMALVIDDQTSIKADVAEKKRLKAEAERVRTMFEQYVHPNVVRELMKNPLALNLGGETKEISVIFADIRGYTRLSENLPPGKVMDMVNGYLDKMCGAIWEEEGTVTAFIGDAIMAIFNAPLPQKMHALHAVRAAWKMREAVRNYQQELPEELRVSFGFGVNTGLATVGNVGARGRLQNYTAIGDTINVAARLQNSATDNDIYMNNSTYEQVYRYTQVDPPLSLSVKNKTSPLTVHRLRRLL